MKKKLHVQSIVYNRSCDVTRHLGILALIFICACSMASTNANSQTRGNQLDTPAQAAQELPRFGALYYLHADMLEVYLTPTEGQQGDPLNTDKSLWVGKVYRDGKEILWVELIDKYGEVIYEAELGENETHLLPDGRSIAVTKSTTNDDSRQQNRAAKQNQMQLVTDPGLKMSFSPYPASPPPYQITLLEPQTQKKEKRSQSSLIEFAKNGEAIAKLWQQPANNIKKPKPKP